MSRVCLRVAVAWRAGPFMGGADAAACRMSGGRRCAWISILFPGWLEFLRAGQPAAWKLQAHRSSIPEPVGQLRVASAGRTPSRLLRGRPCLGWDASFSGAQHAPLENGSQAFSPLGRQSLAEELGEPAPAAWP